ncbi:RES family NAD+ phosphorylase [Geoalkalibacter halelectricus]|uniref:RES family NAD+ phosphorylase n=1 Tax=Geoalkalibacter halelectricus TaxID=2847045 RepID=UPI003D191003
MLLFRVAPEKFARDTSGEGAKLFGARWNPKGVPVLYTATTRSLAVLESLVHASSNDGPISRRLVTFELPDSVSSTQILPEDLPAGWNGNPAPSALAQLGKNWAERNQFLILLVPSAVLPFGDEMNALVNPRHPEFVHLKIKDIRPYLFDERLLKG